VCHKNGTVSIILYSKKLLKYMDELYELGILQTNEETPPEPQGISFHVPIGGFVSFKSITTQFSKSCCCIGSPEKKNKFSIIVAIGARVLFQTTVPSA
jgi:hypothetical protein